MFGKKNEKSTINTAQIQLSPISEAVDFLNRKQHNMNQEDTQTMRDMSAIEKVADELLDAFRTITGSVSRFNEQFMEII